MTDAQSVNIGQAPHHLVRVELQMYTRIHLYVTRSAIALCQQEASYRNLKVILKMSLFRMLHVLQSNNKDDLRVANFLQFMEDKGSI
jgi:hypothetical protein